MSWEVAQKALDYAAARSKFLKIQFTGGEPLLNFELIRQVVAYTRKHRFPVRFQLQTNGTLITTALAQEIKNLMIGVGVSLDGMPEVNDRLRPFADGRGSTVAVLRGLQNLAAQKIKVGITTVLTVENIAQLPRLVELAAYLGNVHGISLDLFRPLGRGVETQIVPPQNDLMEHYIKAALERAEVLVQLGGRRIRFREVERIRYQLEQGVAREFYCYATTGQCLAVLPDGSVYPCASLGGIAEFYLGNVLSKDFSHEEALSRLPFLDRTVDQMEICRECEDRWLCGGGCVARSYAYTGRVDRPYEGDCLLRKIFLDWVKKECRTSG